MPHPLRHPARLSSLLLSTTACVAEPTALDPLAWRPADPSAPIDRPPHTDCAQGWWVEEPFVEVDTGRCVAWTVDQPLPATGRGWRLSGGLTWDDLTPDGPGREAVGTAAVFVGDALVWEHTEPIPGPPGYAGIDAPIPQQARAGDPVTLHLRNHGVNHWRWLPVRLGP